MPRTPFSRQAAVLGGVFALVVATDQAAKYVAWRHGVALLNQGGFIALRRDMRAWFAASTAGAIADAAGAVLVSVGVLVLLRRPRRPAVLLGGALVAAGWTSNLLDRFGLHEWTAPGTVRGVVDFIPTGGGSRSNLADAWIAFGVLVLVGSVVGPAARRRRGSADGELDVALGVDPGVELLVGEELPRRRLEEDAGAVLFEHRVALHRSAGQGEGEGAGGVGGDAHAGVVRNFGHGDQVADLGCCVVGQGQHGRVPSVVGPGRLLHPAESREIMSNRLEPDAPIGNNWNTF